MSILAAIGTIVGIGTGLVQIGATIAGAAQQVIEDEALAKIRWDEIDRLLGLYEDQVTHYFGEQDRILRAAEEMYGEDSILTAKLDEMQAQIGDIETELGIKLEGLGAQRGYLKATAERRMESIGVQMQAIAEAGAERRGMLRAGAAVSGVTASGSILHRASRVSQLQARAMGEFGRERAGVQEGLAYQLGGVGRQESLATLMAGKQTRGLESQMDIMGREGALAYESMLGQAGAAGLTAAGIAGGMETLSAEQQYYIDMGLVPPQIPSIITDGPFAMDEETGWFQTTV